jgi:hypothetical protein
MQEDRRQWRKGLSFLQAGFAVIKLVWKTNKKLDIVTFLHFHQQKNHDISFLSNYLNSQGLLHFPDSDLNVGNKKGFGQKRCDEQSLLIQVL